MADLAAGDVVYALLNQRKLSDSRNLNRVRLTFGGGSETYPAGGVPLTKGKLGCPVIVESLIVVDKGTSGYDFKYDQSTGKLVMFQAPAQTHAHDVLFVDNVVADGATTRVNIGANAIGANTGSNITVSGNGANGGIRNATLAAAAMVEPSAVDIAEQIIEVEVIGW